MSAKDRSCQLHESPFQLQIDFFRVEMLLTNLKSFSHSIIG